MEALPSPQQLRYLIALAELRHFGRAATACSVTQSTLSAGILNLERQLNVAILDRTAGKRVMFTALGEDIATQARIALQGLETVREMISFTHEPFSTPLKLGIIPTIAPYILSFLVERIRQLFPKLSFSIYEDLTESLMEKLLVGHLDLLIIAMPCVCKGAETYALFNDDFYLIMPKEHSFASMKKIDLQDIDTEEIIMLQDGHCLREQTMDMCRQNQIAKVVNDSSNDFLASSLDTIVKMVQAGLGIAFLPALAVQKGVADLENIVVRPLKGNLTWRTVGLAWRKNSLRAHEFKQFEKIFQKEGFKN